MVKLNEDGKLLLADNGDATCECCSSCEDNCADSLPSVCMTISWTDMDTTKNFFGRVWTNGETKTMCPGGFYQCQDAAFNDVEHWEFNAEFRMVARSNGSRFHNMTLWPYGVYTTPVFKQTKNNFGTATNSTGVLSRTGVDISGVPLTQAYISSEYFGSITFSGGVTISWTQNGSHWNPCSNT